MKYLLLFCVCAILAAGCDTRSKELEKQNAELQAKSNELYKELTTRDQYIGEVMDAISGMHENLEGTREKEKLILSEADRLEASKKLSSAEIRQQVLGQIGEIDSAIKSDKKKLAELQAKVRSYRTQFASLNKMIDNLKAKLEEREQAIAALQQRVGELEGEVSLKTLLLAQRDSTINVQESIISKQTSKINTGYYIIGTRRELKEKGVVADEGGLLWGLFGTTTILANGFDKSLFTPINKTTESKIEVNGTISEIVPKRNPNFYSTAAAEDREHSTLQILDADHFWQDNYLVIITN